MAERERLAREAALDNNLLIRNKRILLPSVSEVNGIVAAQIAHFAWPEELPATVMAVRHNGDGPNLEVLENVLYGRELEVETVEEGEFDEAVARVVRQSRLGYGVIAIGADNDPGQTHLSPLADELMRFSDLPIVMVRRATNLPGRQLPGVFARALVPVVASSSSRAAQELAGNLSARLGTRLMLSHVIYKPNADLGLRLFGRLRSPVPVEESSVGERVLAPGSRPRGGGPGHGRHRDPVRDVTGGRNRSSCDGDRGRSHRARCPAPPAR